MSRGKVTGKVIFVGLVLCLVVPWGVFGSEPTTPPVDKGGVLRIAVNEDCDTLFPPTMRRSGPMASIGGVCMESLLAYDKDSKVVPFLATDWKWSDDLLSITFTLRKGVKFHDGTDWNAEAAKWNIMKMATESTYLPTRAIVSVDIIDDYTICCHLSRPDNTILGELTYNGGRIVSPTAYEKYGKEWCNRHPVGTGPFKFISWERDVKQVYKRFDDYWQKGKPYLDGIEFVIIADPMTAKASLLAGEVDVITGIHPKEAADLIATGKFTVHKVPGLYIGFIGDSKDPKSPFAHLKVRQAVEHAIDKKAMVDALFYGFASSTNQMFPEGDPYYSPDVKGYPYNPKKAKELLTEAGYPKGFKTTLLTLAGKIFVDMSTGVQGYLKEVGIDVKIDAAEMGRFQSSLVGKAGWDGLILFFQNRTLPDFDRLSRMVITKESPQYPEMIRAEDIDELTFRALRAPVWKEKIRLNQELMKLVVDKYCIMNCVVNSDAITVSHKKVHGLGKHETTLMWWTPQDAWMEKR